MSAPKLSCSDTLGLVTVWNYISVPLFGYIAFFGSKLAIAYFMAYYGRDVLAEHIQGWWQLSFEQMFRLMMANDQSLNTIATLIGFFLGFLWLQHYRKKYAKYNEHQDTGYLEQVDESKNPGNYRE